MPDASGLLIVTLFTILAPDAQDLFTTTAVCEQTSINHNCIVDLLHNKARAAHTTTYWQDYAQVPAIRCESTEQQHLPAR
jgi:hypothetical protein